MNTLESALIIQIGLAAVTFVLLYVLVSKDAVLKKEIDEETEKPASTPSGG